ALFRSAPPWMAMAQLAVVCAMTGPVKNSRTASTGHQSDEVFMVGMNILTLITTRAGSSKSSPHLRRTQVPKMVAASRRNTWTAQGQSLRSLFFFSSPFALIHWLAGCARVLLVLPFQCLGLPGSPLQRRLNAGLQLIDGLLPIFGD